MLREASQTGEVRGTRSRGLMFGRLNPGAGAMARSGEQPESSNALRRKAEAEVKPVVLIVDDDAFSLMVVSTALAAAGYATRPFDNPQAFLQSDPYGQCGCVILDMSMPGLSGLDVQRAIVENGSPLSIVFVTGAIDVRGSVQAMKGGAVDVLQKPFVLEELLAAVEKAVTQSFRARAIKVNRAAEQALWAELTPREREVGVLVAQGMLNKQIGADLGLSEATVKIHRARAMAKLGVGSSAELSAMIERLGVD